MDSAGTALRQAAAEVWVIQPDVVAERVKQRHVRIDIDVVVLAVDIQGKSLAHLALPRSHVAALITAEFLRQYLLSSLRARGDREKSRRQDENLGRAIAAREMKPGCISSSAEGARIGDMVRPCVAPDAILRHVASWGDRIPHVAQ
jgi:hypothetical protein